MVQGIVQIYGDTQSLWGYIMAFIKYYVTEW